MAQAKDTIVKELTEIELRKTGLQRAENISEGQLAARAETPRSGNYPATVRTGRQPGCNYSALGRCIQKWPYAGGWSRSLLFASSSSNGRPPENRLRHPRFAGFRSDKDANEIPRD
jgi:hypothetical protein